MNSYTSRLNTLGTHGMMTLAVLAGAVIALSYFSPRAVPGVELDLHTMKVLKVMSRGRHQVDQAIFRFNLRTDLRPVMDWNVNGIYVAVLASYETDTHTRNKVVIWDTVIQSRARAILNRRGEYPKYSLKDHGLGLRGRSLKLSLRYTIMPYVGAFETYEVDGVSFALPDEYTA